VQTRWREPHLLFFHRENGADGTAVLLRIRSDGVYFATNRHVIEPPTESDSYSCAIAIDGSRYQVEEIACRTDGLDLALLRFASRQAEGEFEMPIQPLSRIHVGQACIAIGNALGAGRSVTSGVVSRIDVIGNKPTIRTSAAISPGNSGGGLFSLNGGYLIGITSATVTAESAQNVNLAIPADALLDDKWQTFQKVSR
jgi:serine protease Do